MNLHVRQYDIILANLLGTSFFMYIMIISVMDFL